MAKPHPTTDAVLDAQRAALAANTTASTPMSEQRLVARELLWHAMFLVASLDPHVDMQDVANMCRTAIKEGVKAGHAMGNHKL